MNALQLVVVAFDILSSTSILVLLVLGLGVVVGMMGVFNFAHGELVLLGALTPFVVVQLGGSVWLGLLAAPFVVGLIGLIVERLIIRHLYGLPLTALLVTWGLGLSIRETVRLALGQSTRSVPYPLADTVSLGSVALPEWRLFVVVVTCIVVGVSYLVLRYSAIGLRVRATLENADLARASGIRPARLYAGTFVFGSALAGLAGALIVPLTSLYPELGVTYLVRSFLGLIVGGIGSFDGPVLGATLMGISGGSLPWFLPPVQADIVVFMLAIVLLRFRPQGMRGSSRSS
jgi:branched-chain amino acid transport system permease protein